MRNNSNTPHKRLFHLIDTTLVAYILLTIIRLNNFNAFYKIVGWNIKKE